MKIYRIFIATLALITLLNGCKDATFTNPILPNGADPFAVYHNNNYYYTHTLGDSVGLWRTGDITDLKSAEYKTIWIPAQGQPYSKALWAPEIHNIDGKWYCYVTATDGNRFNRRIFVLENESPDPFEGEFVLKGKVASPDDNWAIDASVAKINGELYMVWSGFKETPYLDYVTQRIYIAKMSNPWTISSERLEISAPTYDWERIYKVKKNRAEVYVNEGPEFLFHKDKVYIIYSGSACWTPEYKLGMLYADIQSDLMDLTSWTKHDKPVFQQSIENGVYGPGHNSFLKSPDGKEDWNLYHANDNPDDGCGKSRKPRLQKVEWNKEGAPVFGIPQATNTPMKKPSGLR
jgi:GH43 family beta-xylosidase